MAWEDLEGSGCSRHCQSCNTPVVDLTTKSTEEIAEFLMKEKGRVCARVYQSQLDKVIDRNRHRKSLLKAAAIFALGFASILPACQPESYNYQGQTKETKPMKVRQTFAKPKNFNWDELLGTSIKFSGVVLDADDKYPLPQVTVLVNGKGVAPTDRLGVFSIEIPASAYKKGFVTIGFRYLGYTTQEVKVGPVAYDNIKVKLQPDVTAVGEVVIVDDKKTKKRKKN